MELDNKQRMIARIVYIIVATFLILSYAYGTEDGERFSPMTVGFWIVLSFVGFGLMEWFFSYDIKEQREHEEKSKKVLNEKKDK